MPASPTQSGSLDYLIYCDSDLARLNFRFDNLRDSTMTQSGRGHNNEIMAKFVVRLPRGLKETVSRIARINRRSTNSEIVVRLEKSIEQSEDSTESDTTGTEQPDDAVFKDDLSPFEVRLIIFYRRLSRDKRKALLSLFAG